jgi:hypothetical protein
MKSGYPLTLAALSLGISFALAVSGAARAAEQPDQMSDGAYGRFDGDVSVSLAAGAAVGPDGPAGALIGRALFFETAGFYVAYTDALGSAQAALPRTFGTGITIRPLFIPRWALDLERGPAILDLTLDSLSFDLGVLWIARPDGSLSDRAGMEAALGAEVPFFGRANGLFIGARGALRWRAGELAGRTDAPLEPALFLTLGWHALIDANIVDAGDRRMR